MQNRICAFLTMQEPGDFVMDYDLCFEAMAEHGWQVETVAWRSKDIDWDGYDAVYPCTAWDYPAHLDEFVAVLTQIEISSATLVNPLSLINWNMRKTYLRDLEAAGAEIVPSLWFAGIEATNIDDWFAAQSSDTLICKPEVGANAVDTFVLRQPVDADTQALLATAYRNRPFMVQPFIESIRREGEFSLFYFAGEFSHAILKTPTAGDYRSQEEFGAEIKSVDPEPALRVAGDRIVALLDPLPVYARVDLIRGPDGRFLLMELELVEPSLYFRTDAAAPARFAAAFDSYCNTAM